LNGLDYLCKISMYLKLRRFKTWNAMSWRLMGQEKVWTDQIKILGPAGVAKNIMQWWGLIPWSFSWADIVLAPLWDVRFTHLKRCENGPICESFHIKIYACINEWQQMFWLCKWVQINNPSGSRMKIVERPPPKRHVAGVT
jgi:hypothetical protein